MKNNYPQKIEPISIRQTAIAILVILVCALLIGVFIYNRQKHKKPVYLKPVIPKVIKAKIASDPDRMESTTFVFPLVK